MSQNHGCEEWHHQKYIECIDTEIREMRPDSFNCWWCEPQDTFLNSCTKQTDVVCPALESMTVDEDC